LKKADKKYQRQTANTILTIVGLTFVNSIFVVLLGFVQKLGRPFHYAPLWPSRHRNR
jgi:hypothetical protein